MRKRKTMARAGALAAGLLALCGGLWLSLGAGIAHAVPEESQHHNGPIDRTWENYFGVAILSSGRAIVVGDKGLIMTSDDQGKTWTLQPTKVASALMKVAVVDAQKACAVGEHGAVVCTADDGATWMTQKFEDMVFFDVAFTDANNGWAVGEFATVVNTTDGGKTWTVKNGGKRVLTADPYFAIAFNDANNGLVFGLNGIELKTADGGKTWSPGALAGAPYSFYAAAPGEGGTVYVAGVDGVTGRVAQDKLTRTTSGSSNSINAVALAPQFGLAVGLSGTIIRTMDNGQSWSGLTAGDSAQARAQ